MSRLATSFVLGYHGCDRATAELAVAGETGLIQSDRAYDWLGPGAYFWESDPQRALEWARWKVERGDYREACVIGAVIDLGNCLDLVARENVELVRAAYRSFEAIQALAGLPLPENRNPKGMDGDDRPLRFLDCAVIKHLHEIMSAEPRVGGVQPFDTVRGLFVEGERAYPGSAFRAKSHVQIAVRNADCIKGLFYPIGPEAATVMAQP